MIINLILEFHKYLNLTKLKNTCFIYSNRSRTTFDCGNRSK